MIKIYNKRNKLIVDLRDKYEDVEDELKEDIKDILSVYKFKTGDGFENEDIYEIDFTGREREQNVLLEKLVEIVEENNNEEDYWRYI